MTRGCFRHARNIFWGTNSLLSACGLRRPVFVSFGSSDNGSEGNAVEIQCPACHQTFQIAQNYQYHAGFSNEGFLYCDSCPNLVVFSSYDPRYTKIVGERHPWALTDSDCRTVEDHLRPCTCGGHFCFSAAPRCPLCNATIRQILYGSIYYVETGKRFDPDKEEVWTAS